MVKRLKRKKEITNLCGGRIREARERLRMPIVEVMAALHVDHGILIDTTALGRIERLQRSLYDYELLALSQVLEVSVEWLLTGKEDK